MQFSFEFFSSICQLKTILNKNRNNNKNSFGLKIFLNYWVIWVYVFNLEFSSITYIILTKQNESNQISLLKHVINKGIIWCGKTPKYKK